MINDGHIFQVESEWKRWEPVRDIFQKYSGGLGKLYLYVKFLNHKYPHKKLQNKVNTYIKQKRYNIER